MGSEVGLRRGGIEGGIRWSGMDEIEEWDRIVWDGMGGWGWNSTE